ncbi:hypothetical protein D8I24_3543 [Cupriavidus necator H850]|nr:hypothetical protein D8I24_3543 [Cupriavidus necator H850]
MPASDIALHDPLSACRARVIGQANEGRRF